MKRVFEVRPTFVVRRLCRCLVAMGASLVMTVSAAPYSPPVADAYPDNVYWGDTHIHTWLSGDAFGMGTRETPDQAYRLARGEEVRSTGGAMVRLRRPLDFAMVADHAENIGMLALLISRDERVLNTSDGAKYYELLSGLPELSEVLNAESLEEFQSGMNALLGPGKSAWSGNYEASTPLRQEVWGRVIDTAERYNVPGRFTAFTGYEYSSSGPMLHRNVMFVGGPDQTSRTLPYSRDDSRDPADLWTHLLKYKAETGSDVIAIPHNSNLSGGNMFRGATYMGQPLTPEYARIRASLEPVVEVTQIKGTSETHPFISPDDPFADYETWSKYSVPAPAKSGGGKDVSKTEGKGKATSKDSGKGQDAKPPAKGGDQTAAQKQPQAVSLGSVAHAGNATQEELARQSHVRSGLQLGLQHERTLGTNPFKLGMIGSTDSHTGLATADDDNFWGKMGPQEAGRYRAQTLSQFDASGYAAVWAQENTRESIFAAFRRREVYASTGPRIRLRFFGGWDFESDDVLRPDFARVGYAQGVPMGGDLVGDHQVAPGFLIHAARDPDGANLDRVQVIKGWLTGKGETRERVYDVAWSDNRKVDDKGQLAPIRSTVDVQSATYLNSVGAAELAVMWRDPDFDPDEPAFYYIRVLQIPTPRWTAYDAAFYGLELPASIPVVTQERAYSSPIWYSPAD